MAPGPEEVRDALRARIGAIEGGFALPAEGALASPPAPWGPGGAPRAAEAGPADEERRAFGRIARLATMREQASFALRRRLAREGFGEDAVERALGRALSCGLVDDARYADVLVRSRLAQGRGRQGIAAELAGLDIDPGSVEALEGPEEGGEVQRALEALRRRPPRAKNARDAAYRRLVQKGFGAAEASTAARLWSEQDAL